MQGVFTRKVRNILEKMCDLEVSSSQVSDAAKTLDDEIERLNKEIKKRTRIVGVFLNEAACERLVGSLLMRHEEWMEEKAYLTEKEAGKSAFYA